MYALAAFHAAEAAKPTGLSASQLWSEFPVSQQDTCTILSLASMTDCPAWSPSSLFRSELYHSLDSLARVNFLQALPFLCDLRIKECERTCSACLSGKRYSQSMNDKITWRIDRMSVVLDQNRGSAKEAHSLFHANPILKKLSKAQDHAESSCATYRGIALKTCYFMIATLFGLLLQVILQNTVLAGQAALYSFSIADGIAITVSRLEVMILAGTLFAGFLSHLVSIFVRRTIPVTGTLYCISEGYFISFLVFKALGKYRFLGIEALLLTIVVVGVMSWLYTSGKIRVGNKFHVVLMTMIISSIAFSLMLAVTAMIPATSAIAHQLLHNVGLMIAVDVFGILIAALFLISDFSLIDTCVQEHYAKEYEWSAAYGLAFTVLWLYMKILDLLMHVVSKKDN